MMSVSWSGALGKVLLRNNLMPLNAARRICLGTVTHKACSGEPPLVRLCRKRWVIQRNAWFPSTNRTVSTGVSFDDYEKARQEFQLDVPEYYNYARDVIDKWASLEQTGERGSDNPALWWIDEHGKDVKWSFQQISEYSKRVANILSDNCQLKPLDRMMVILPRIPSWWLFNIGAIRSGVVFIPGTSLLTSKDIRHRLLSSRAKCIVTDVQRADSVDQVAQESPYLKTKILCASGDEPRPGWLNFDDLFFQANSNYEVVNTRGCDPMMLFFTSGTTGAPKMTEHTHHSYGLGHTLTARYMLEAKPSDIIWNLSDTGWAKAAWTSLFAPWIAGACIFQQNSTTFDPNSTMKILQDYPISLFCCPPTAMRLLIKCDMGAYDVSSVQRTVSGGEPVNPEILQEWKDGTGLTVYEIYGQTETTFICGTYPCIEQRAGSMGKACPGIDLQIVTEDGNIVPRGEEGIVGIRCKPDRPVGLFSQYLDDPVGTAAVFQGDFYLTGDRATMDGDDYIWFVGRNDDIITSAGYRIGPFEVESALLEHHAVAESAVVSSPDPVRGEVVKAFITLTEEYKNVADPEALKVELQAFVKSHTAPYKYPRKIEFVDQLPKTVSGKIRRIELRQREWSKQQ